MRKYSQEVKGMDCYIYRLMRLGFDILSAFRKYDEYMCQGRMDDLDKYITDMESDLYVD